MIGPYLFVGTGGAGRQTVDWLYNELKNRLIKAGWPWNEREANGRAMPGCWQFVGIDVESNVNTGAELNLPPTAVKFLALSKYPEQMTNVYTALKNQPIGLSTLGWVPPATEIHQFNPYDGAGQYRAIGRAVLLSKITEISNTLNAVASSLASPDAQNDLRDLQYLLGEEPGEVLPRVIMFSSLSGGSGSGLWLDVAQWFAGQASVAAKAWMAQRSYAFCYLPEVFELISGPDAGIAPNSLYGVNEFLSACANRGPLDEISRPLAAAMGVHSTDPIRRVPGAVFFLGRRNSEGVEFQKLSQVYSTVAQTVGALVMSGAASDFDRIAVNAGGRADAPLFNRYDVASSTLGYSRLELGRGALSSYMQRRLLREAANRLLFGYEEFRNNTFESESTIIERLADEHASTFFDRCHLHERDLDKTQNNQVLEGLLPQIQADRIRNTNSEGIFDRVRDFVKFTAEEVKVALAAQLRDRDNQASTEVSVEAITNATVFAATVRKAVLNTVADFSVDYSVPVVLRLLAKLDDQLVVAQGQLLGEIDRANALQAAADAELVATLANKKTFGDPKTPGSLDRALKKFVTSSTQIQIRQIAPGFIEEVRRNLVKPLIDALKAWHASATEAVKRDQWQTLLRQWNGVDMPTELTAAPNVVRIEDSSRVQSQFDEVLQQHFGEAPAGALRSAVKQIVKGDWLGAEIPSQYRATKADTDQTFAREEKIFGLSRLLEPTPTGVDPSQHARTKAGWFRTEHVFGDKATFTIAPLAGLEAGVRSWVTKVPGHVSTYVNEGIGAWLDPRGASAGERANLFKAKFNAAIDLGSPLMSYSIEGMERVHGIQRPEETIVIDPFVPVQHGGALANDVNVSLDQHGLPANSVTFVNDRDTEVIEVIRGYKDPVHPMAMNSLTESTASLVAVNNENTWRARRSRPMSQALPLTQAQLVAFMRGWLQINMFKLIDIERGQVTFPNGVGVVPIPRAGLRGRTPEYYAGNAPIRASNWLTIALEGLPIVTLRYALQPNDLEWYVHVIRLGGYVPESDDASEQDKVANQDGINSATFHGLHIDLPHLAAWIAQGTSPVGGTAPAPEWVGVAGDSADSRRQVALGRLDALEQQFNADAGERLARPADSVATSVSVEQELYLQILAAIDHLRTVITDRPTTVSPRIEI